MKITYHKLDIYGTKRELENALSQEGYSKVQIIHLLSAILGLKDSGTQGISRTAVYNWFNLKCKNFPSIDHLVILASLLHRSTDSILRTITNTEDVDR